MLLAQMQGNNLIAQQQEQGSQLLSEVEQRLEKAQYYKLLLNGWLFDGDNSPSATAVMEEIREFVVDRLNVLMGLKNEVQAPVNNFTDEEIWALKGVASKVLQRPNIVAPPQPKPQPQQPRAKPQPKLNSVRMNNRPQQPQQMQQRASGVPTTKKAVAAPQRAEQYPPPDRIPFPTGMALTMATSQMAEKSMANQPDIGSMAADQLGVNRK
jgi:hypothetical protein